MTIDPRVLMEMPAQFLEAISRIIPDDDLLPCSADDRFSPGEIVKIATRIAFDRFDRHMPKPLKADDEFICF